MVKPTIRAQILNSIYGCVHFNVREDNRTVKKRQYVAIGIKLTGEKEVLGMWIGDNESSKYWLSVLNEIKNRGVEDILIVSVDGLTGFGPLLLSKKYY